MKDMQISYGKSIFAYVLFQTHCFLIFCCTLTINSVHMENLKGIKDTLNMMHRFHVSSTEEATLCTCCCLLNYKHKNVIIRIRMYNQSCLSRTGRKLTCFICKTNEIILYRLNGTGTSGNIYLPLWLGRIRFVISDKWSVTYTEQQFCQHSIHI